ncbi:MAG: glutathione S-transferase family protein [Oceanicaulis sp.]
MVPEPRLTLYHAPMSRSVRVRWCLEEMGLPHKLERVAFDRGNVGGEAYRAINPIQKVPALTDGDLVILESVAIVQYLVTKHGATPLAVEPGEPDYARYLEWLHFGEATMSMATNLVLAHSFLLPEHQRNPQMLKWARQTVDTQLGLIAQRGLADGREFLAAGRLTAADMSVGYMLYLLKITKQFDGAPEPVRAYFDRLRALDSWKRASAD